MHGAIWSDDGVTQALRDMRSVIAEWETVMSHWEHDGHAEDLDFNEMAVIEMRLFKVLGEFELAREMFEVRRRLGD